MARREADEQVLSALANVLAEERERQREEWRRWQEHRREEFWRLGSELIEELRSALAEELRELTSMVREKFDELDAAHEDRARALAAENAGLRRENDELRALCAESREARGPLDHIETQRDPDRPPQ